MIIIITFFQKVISWVKKNVYRFLILIEIAYVIWQLATGRIDEYEFQWELLIIILEFASDKTSAS